MQRDKYFATWSSLHGNAEISGIVKTWLAISYRIVGPLHKLRVTPNFVTLIGLVAAIATWPTALTWWAPALLVLSLFCDGIDGSLAMISEKSSTRGAMIDSIVDRLSEVFWVLAFYRLGADFRLIMIAWVLAFTQEYIRARSAGLGEREIGAVTIAERPVRASLLFIALISYLLNLEIVNVVAAVWAAMQAIAFIHLSSVYFKRLKLR